MLFHPRMDGGVPLDSAIESQQVRSHRRSTFCFRDLGYRTPAAREPRRNEIEAAPPRVRIVPTLLADRKSSLQPLSQDPSATQPGALFNLLEIKVFGHHRNCSGTPEA